MSTQAVDERKKLQELMMFLGALALGSDKILKQSAIPISRKIGREAVAKAKPRQTKDLKEAIKILADVLKELGVWWTFYLWKKESDAEFFTKTGNKIETKIVFLDCMIRNTLFTIAHQQKGALCYMNHGFFEGALEAITGMKVKLDIVHAGENGCIKTLTLEEVTE
jgi:predicted ArsR family transcriptional regulator